MSRQLEVTLVSPSRGLCAPTDASALFCVYILFFFCGCYQSSLFLPCWSAAGCIPRALLPLSRLALHRCCCCMERRRGGRCLDLKHTRAQSRDPAVPRALSPFIALRFNFDATVLACRPCNDARADLYLYTTLRGFSPPPLFDYSCPICVSRVCVSSSGLLQLDFERPPCPRCGWSGQPPSEGPAVFFQRSCSFCICSVICLL